MRRYILCLFIVTFLPASLLKAWGHKAHEIIAQIAKSQLDKTTIDNVDYYLKGLTWEEAACWMDSVKTIKKYDFMKLWHYVNFEKDKTYVNKQNLNIINQLELCINLFKNRRILPIDMVHDKLKVLFHLVGDIHQPLHCGYESDKGGTTVRVKLHEKDMDLHHVWDTEIITLKKIDIWDCTKVMMGLSHKEKTEIQKIDVMAWVNESRNMLPAVYSFKNGKIENDYLDMNALIVRKQLTKAGLRLASVLKSSFSG